MFVTRAEVEKLGAMHAVPPTVLSLYLAVPARPAELPALPARARELIAAAERAAGGLAHVAGEDPDAVCQKLATCGPDWLGRTVAVFACADIGLLQALPLPCALPERAVLGTRPHVRPLLLAMQRCPAVVDSREPLIEGLTEQRARSLADEILAMPPGGLAAVGLPACLAAVNASAVETLVVPDDGLVPGYECGRCGALSIDADSCPDWGTAPLHVPDVIEEMVTRTLEDGGRVAVLSEVRCRFAARLYFPLAQC